MDNARAIHEGLQVNRIDIENAEQVKAMADQQADILRSKQALFFHQHKICDLTDMADLTTASNCLNEAEAALRRIRSRPITENPRAN